MNIREHPTGFWFIFWGEYAERASFYGMKALLVLYMIDKLGYSDADSATVASIFTASCYIAPIIGGYVADRWLGKFRTIIYFAIPYIMGHIILGSFETSTGLYVALALLAGGSGSVKPNISTLMGLMYEQAGKSHLLSQAFSFFYMAINIGAASTMLTLPFIRDHYGYSAAFMAPTVLMVVSLGIFYLGKRHYPVEDVKSQYEKPRASAQKSEDRRITWRIMGLFALIVFFWSVFDQAYSTWTLFARDYLILDTFLGTIPPDAIQGLNPVLIVILTPFFAWLWSKTDKSEKVRLSSPKKMLIGFVLVIFCMALMTVAGFVAVENKVSILWEVFAYILMTSAELCISVIGLQLAFEEAPNHMKSRITALWWTTVFFGNILAGLFARVYTAIKPGEYFGLMTIMIIIVTIGFYFVGKRFEKPRQAEVDTQSLKS
ncbi:MAG: MFS transporter [candidate division Zixibacteria bacterium]|nr:MFS transporter [candidate division Zixibacteria bacterium]